jgi:DinB superfamily
VTASVLRQQLGDLEDAKSRLLGSLADLPADTMNRSPGSGRWSIVQVISHVTQSEALSVSYVNHKLKDPSGLPKAGLAARLRLALLVLALRSPLRVRAPQNVAVVPESASPEETARRWDEVRASLGELVAAFPRDHLQTAIFRHPFAGRLSLAHMLTFMSEHLAHHVRQIETIRRTV